MRFWVKILVALAAVVLLATLAVTSPLLRPDKRVHLDRATLAYDGGRYAEAVFHARRALQADGDYHPAWALLADALLKAGEFDAALVAFDRILDGQPTSARALHGKGVANLRRGQLVLAEHNAERLVALHPKWAPSHELAAAAHLAAFEQAVDVAAARLTAFADRREAAALAGDMRLGRFESALRFSQQFLDGRRDDQARTALARVIRDALTHHERARQELIETVRRDASLATAQLSLAALEADSGDLDAATARYRHVLDAIDPGSVEASLGLVRTLSDLGETDRALVEASRLLAEDPSRTAARIELTRLHLDAGRYDAALGEAGVLSHLSAGDMREPYLVALMQLRQRKYSRAISSLLGVVAERPGWAPARYNLARALLESGRPMQAISAFHSLMNVAPDFIPGRLGMAQASLEAQWYSDVIDHCNSVLARDPNNLDALRLKAAALTGQGEFLEAQTFFERIVAINNDLQEAHLGVAAIKLARGEVDDVIEQYQSELVQTPNDLTALTILGFAYLQKGMADQALAQFRRTVLADPAYVIGYLNLGRAYALVGRFDDASSQYERALVIADSARRLTRLADPKPRPREVFLAPVQIRMGMAQLSEFRRQYDEALKHYQSELAQDQPGYLPAKLALIELHLRLGEDDALHYASTIARCEEIIADDAASVPAHTLLAVTARRLGNWERAAAEFETALAHNPAWRPAYDVARMYSVRALERDLGRPLRGELPPGFIDLSTSTQGILAKAAAHLRAGLDVYPGDADLLVGLGVIEQQRGDAAAALDAYRAAVEREPESVTLRLAAATLLAAQGDIDDARGLLAVQQVRPEFARAFEQLAKQDPELLGRLALLHNAAAWMARSGRHDDATGMYELAVDIWPQDVLALSAAAAVHDQNQDAEAYFLLERVLELDPDSVTAHVHLAQIMMERGSEEALRFARRVAELEPAFWPARVQEARWLVKRQDFDQAIAAYEAALEHHSGPVAALNHLAPPVERFGGAVDRAVALGRRARALTPPNGIATETLRYLYFIDKDGDVTHRYLTTALLLTLDKAALHYEMAELCRRDDRSQQAVEHYEAALRLDPKLPEAPRAKAALAELRP